AEDPKPVTIQIQSTATIPAIKIEPAKKAAPQKAENSGATPIITVISSVVGGKDPTAEAQKQAAEKGSHKAGQPIKVVSNDGNSRLQTLCADAEGRVLALVAPPRGFTSNAKSPLPTEVHVFSPEGKALTNWKVPFMGQAINVGPDNNVFVAGEGKVARFDREGKLLSEVELPYIADALKNREAMRKEAEQELKQQKESFQKTVEQFKKRVDELKKIDEDKRTALQKKQLAQQEQILKSFSQTENYYKSLNVDSILQGKLSRLSIINGIAISGRDVFVACGETKGYGYVVWRMDHDFKNASPVLKGLGGCCGQMDVQCGGEDLLVAENTRYQFARYDRDGKKIGSWGKRTTGSEISSFGGCCNPMNLRACKSSEILTAESEGIIKRFSDKGDFLGVVGHAPLKGGCKNVAVAVSPDGQRVYFADQPGSQIIVLEKKPASVKAN
ncbi:MAG: hypothetical protein ACKO23_05115, partial [Gemmataceae bacterium]